jgi:phosphotransferase system  glucose/maltose/N-acetylglucosamine-specific IIC component
MSKSKIKRSIVFPVIMLAYLAVMAWVGRDRLDRGEYLYYFGIIGVGLVIIVLLYFSLRKKEQLQQRREEEQQYGTYEEEEIKEEKSKDKN